MIRENKREAVLTLYDEGKKKKEIARLLNITPKTIRKIIKSEGEISLKPRCDKKSIDLDLLKRIYSRCDGYAERVYEVLTAEHGFDGGYSTVTKIIREAGIGQQILSRCHQVPDIPGEEMQHDTTVYSLKINGEKVSVICSGIYLRYSKMRYIKFYPMFNRFKMKCFFHEALKFWEYTAKQCVIDNTNLAVLHGTGREALFHPEMIAFARQYGFVWFAHEKGHANRKAGKERNFWTVETNFLPGRVFESMEDLNRQAFEWATNKYALRPQAKTHLVPIELFEIEKSELIKLPVFIEPPYQSHKREIDQYGYAAFSGNYYWIPGKSGGKVEIIEYSGNIKIYQEHKPLIQYQLPDSKIKNKKFAPEGVDTNPYEPKNIKKPCHEEEKILRDKGKPCSDYLDFIKSEISNVKQKPKFIRELYTLSKKIADTLFTAVIERALRYQVTSIDALARISYQMIKKELIGMPEISVSNDYETREEYQKGRFSQEEEQKFYQETVDQKDKEACES